VVLPSLCEEKEADIETVPAEEVATSQRLCVDANSKLEAPGVPV